MENEKRKLYPWERALGVIGGVLLIAAVVFYICRLTSPTNDWPHSVAWICICISQIINYVIRWEDRSKANVVFLWLWGIMLVGHIVLLVSRLFF